jgi:hypothetical protein
MAEQEITLTFEEAQRLFDMAIQMDTMCSGYMETDDVELMRALAVRLGVDPTEATPSQFAGQYPHQYRGGYSQLEWLREGNPPGSDPPHEWRKVHEHCRVSSCYKAEEDPIHGDQS